MTKTQKIILISSSAFVLSMGIYVMTQKRRIVRFSKSLLGEEETFNNMGFKSDEFQDLMESVDWKPGDAWCVYFVKAVLMSKAKDKFKPIIDQLITSNSNQTWNNVYNHQENSADPLLMITHYPKPGDAVIWQSFKNGQPSLIPGTSYVAGHAGIVSKVSGNTFHSIEGNTDDQKSGRGYIVAEHEHNYDYKLDTGHRLLGFITINNKIL